MDAHHQSKALPVSHQQIAWMKTVHKGISFYQLDGEDHRNLTVSPSIGHPNRHDTCGTMGRGCFVDHHDHHGTAERMENRMPPTTYWTEAKARVTTHALTPAMLVKQAATVQEARSTTHYGAGFRMDDLPVEVFKVLNRRIAGRFWPEYYKIHRDSRDFIPGEQVQGVRIPGTDDMEYIRLVMGLDGEHGGHIYLPLKNKAGEWLLESVTKALPSRVAHTTVVEQAHQNTMPGRVNKGVPEARKMVKKSTIGDMFFRLMGVSCEEHKGPRPRSYCGVHTSDELEKPDLEGTTIEK